jgi:hypothetical protein
LVVALLPSLAPLPQLVPAKDDQANGEQEYNSSDCYSHNSGDRQFIASVPIVVIDITISFQERRDNSRHDFQLIEEFCRAEESIDDFQIICGPKEITTNIEANAQKIARCYKK